MSEPRFLRFTVAYEVPVYFTRDVFDAKNGDLVAALSAREPERRHRFVAIVDRGVRDAWPDLGARIEAYAAHHAARLELVCEPLTVEGGEAVKNDPAAVGALQAKLDALGMDRQSFAVLVGGGAMLDMAGFAAATTHRGLRVARVPTTVLAQADSGVGVKNGVNAFGKKNLVGTFAPPFAVLVDPLFLATLDRRDTIAGMAEAVKVALVRDAGFFGWLAEHAADLARAEPPAVEHLVRRCAELHLEHIATSGDPFEFGSARPLDFGHWSAHKLETLTENRLRHGEAVAIGIALDTLYAEAIGLCDAATSSAVLRVLRAIGFRLWDDALDRRADDGRLAVLAGLAEFREHLGGELTIALVREPGRCVDVHALDERLVAAAVARLRDLDEEARS